MPPRVNSCTAFAYALLASWVLAGGVTSVLAQAPHTPAAYDTSAPGQVLASAGEGPAGKPAAERVIVLRPAIPAYFPGCDTAPEGSEEKVACATEKLMGYISRELTYPEAAREQGVQGVAVLTFVVTDAGGVDDIHILRDIGGGCGAEAARVIAMMPRWQPAIHEGRPVHTQLMLPITFGLRANLYDYALRPGRLTGETATREEVVRAATEDEWTALDPQRKPLTITEVVYTLERGGQQAQLITRGTERPDAREMAKFLGRRPARLTIEANVVDGLDIRTVTRQFALVR